MNVLVNGLGNIGTTLLGFLIKYKDQFGIDTIYALKNRPLTWEQKLHHYYESNGVQLILGKDSIGPIVKDIHYVFDCTTNGMGLANKPWYESFTSLKGASAQGSEEGFGESVMYGVNEGQFETEKYAHVVSCNTHAIVSLLKHFSGNDFDKVAKSDFVIVRRSEDLGNHERLVAANVVARHRDEVLGTHHAVDANALLQSIGKTVIMQSSDITTPSQLMHGVRFNMELQEDFNFDKTVYTGLVGETSVFDSNKIFESGRRFGFQGRLYNHAIVVSNNLLKTKNSVAGWAFVPQEGNTILSTLAVFLSQTMGAKQSKLVMEGLITKYASLY